MTNLQLELKKRFGFQDFRPGQEEVVSSILNGHDTLAILPTGMGKSLCYQLPGEMMDGLVIIVSPLVSLMEDQATSIRKRGEKRVAALNSFMTAEQRKQLFMDMHSLKFLFISPEMLNRPDIIRFLTTLTVAFLVVDEAHCISQWGFDFRPDYLRLKEFIDKAGNPQVLALTATADRQVEVDIQTYLNMTNVTIVRQSLNRPNIYYSVQPVEDEQEKNRWMVERLSTTSGPGIIYVASRKRADELSALLKTYGISIESYHAGKEASDRYLIQHQFLSGELSWICATNAFGMGIHKDNIRQIIHDQISASPAAYVQEAGRAGRDGKPSSAVILYSQNDEQKVRFIVQKDLPEEAEVRYFVTLKEGGHSSESAAKLSGVSETGARLIEYYNDLYSVEDIIKTFTSLKYFKEEKLRQMVMLVSANACLRKNLLHFFDEDRSAAQPLCCYVCAHSDEPWLLSTKPVFHQKTLDDWKNRIHHLLS